MKYIKKFEEDFSYNNINFKEESVIDMFKTKLKDLVKTFVDFKLKIGNSDSSIDFSLDLDNLKLPGIILICYIYFDNNIYKIRINDYTYYNIDLDESSIKANKRADILWKYLDMSLSDFSNDKRMNDGWYHLSSENFMEMISVLDIGVALSRIEIMNDIKKYNL